MKQIDAAKKLGISQQAYSKIECCPGITETKTLKILKAFDSNKEDLDLYCTVFTSPPLVIHNCQVGLHPSFLQKQLYV